MSRLAKISILVAVLILGGIAAAMAIWRPWAKLDGTLIELDLERPDALVSSAHLSRLPADMLKVPMLREVLSEDFVFYYANTETQKSVEGAIRRIAFEHELTLTDRLLASLLDEPADLALWRGPNGKLRYWVMSIRRNALSKTLEGLAKIAAKDSQLQVAGELGANGKKTTLYALHLNDGRTLLFAAMGERMVVLSDAAILFGERKAPTPPKAEQMNEAEFYAPKPPHIDPPDNLSGLDRDRANKIADLLAGKPAGNIFAKRFKHEDTLPAGHRVSLAADFLSFGYQGFFPGVEALGFEYDGKAWRSSLLADGKALSANFAPLWQALPGQPAACFALPANWAEVKSLAETGMAGQTLDFAALAAGLDGPVGVCWYAKSKLATPLFLARFKDEASARKLAPLLSKVFEAAIGAHEYNQENGKFPAQSKKTQGGTLLSRIVSSPYGNEKPKGDELGDQLSASRLFRVSLALTGKIVAFSPDAKLAEDALAVSLKRYPAAGDGLKDAPHTLLRVTPARLARLLQTEAMAALPKDEEPVFNGAAQNLLLPRLAALGRQPAIVAALPAAPASGLRWQPLSWSQEGKK